MGYGVTVEHKVCQRCKRDLPEVAFASMARGDDGLQKWCRECFSKHYSKQYREQRTEMETKWGGCYICGSYDRLRFVFAGDQDLLETVPGGKAPFCHRCRKIRSTLLHSRVAPMWAYDVLVSLRDSDRLDIPLDEVVPYGRDINKLDKKEAMRRLYGEQ